MAARHQRAGAEDGAEGEAERYASRQGNVDAGEVEDDFHQHRPERHRDDRVVVAGAQPMAGEDVIERAGGPPALVGELGGIVGPARVVGEIGAEVQEAGDGKQAQQNPDGPAKKTQHRGGFFSCGWHQAQYIEPVRPRGGDGSRARTA